MSQKNTMLKLPNGSRVISYEFGSCLTALCPLHLRLSGKRHSQGLTLSINASSSIAFDNVDYHQITRRHPA
jgi:hypothetical protein